MQKIYRLGLLFLLMFCTPLLSRQYISADYTYRVVIEDDADLLSESEENMLYMKMENILPYGNVAFVTTEQYTDTADFARNTYRRLFGTDSGILFVIDMGRRNIWFFSDGRIYRTVNKAYANTIADNVFMYARNGDYYDCAFYAFDQVQTLLEGGKIAQPMKYISNAMIAVVSAVLINFFILSLERKNDRQFVDHAKELTSAVVISIGKQKLSTKKSIHVEVSSDSGSSGGGGYSGGGSSGGGSSGGGGGHSF